MFRKAPGQAERCVSAVYHQIKTQLLGRPVKKPEVLLAHYITTVLFFSSWWWGTNCCVLSFQVTRLCSGKSQLLRNL